MERWFNFSRHSPTDTRMMNTNPIGDLNPREVDIWMQLMRQWHTPGLRQRMAETLPDLIATLWSADFMGLLDGHKVMEKTTVAQLPLLLSSTALTAKNQGNTQWWCRDLFHKFILYMYSHARISTTVLVLGLLYVHQLRRHQIGIKGASGSEYRLYLMGLIMANKFTEDHPYTNKCWGSIAGVRGVEVNRMEREFLEACEHDIYIPQATFQQWTIKLATLCDWMGWCRPTTHNLLNNYSEDETSSMSGSSKTSWTTASPFLPSPDDRGRRER